MSRGIAAAVAACLFISAASVAVDSNRVTWEWLGEGRLHKAVVRLAGEGAADCGFIDLVNHKPARSERRRSLECMAKARRAGSAFKYGTIRLPIDSIATEIYVQPANGNPWMVVHDSMLGDEFVQMWVMSCKAVEVDRRTMIMDGVECVEREEELERAR